MLTKRIIACLDVDHGRVVKGTKFTGLQDVNDPVELAKHYSEIGIDELVFYDITASNEKRDIFLNVVQETAFNVYIPFTVGGGIRTIDDFNNVLKAGADKVSVNSAAVKDPSIISRAALKFGNQCVVLSIDAKASGDSWEVYIDGGRTPTGIDAVEWAKKGEALGAGELVLNCIDTDGIKDGFDLRLNRVVSEEVSIPVIASGGAGKMEHFLDVFKEGKADAGLAASVFHFGEIDVMELKRYLSDNGVNMRI